MWLNRIGVFNLVWYIPVQDSQSTSLYIRVYDLKAKLFSLTNIPPERQKILGLVKGRLPPDGDTMCVLTPSFGRTYELTK